MNVILARQLMECKDLLPPRVFGALYRDKRGALDAFTFDDLRKEVAREDGGVILLVRGIGVIGLQEVRRVLLSDIKTPNVDMPIRCLECNEVITEDNRYPYEWLFCSIECMKLSRQRRIKSRWLYLRTEKSKKIKGVCERCRAPLFKSTRFCSRKCAKGPIQMTERDKEALSLAVQGLSLQEIASRMGVTRARVWQILNKHGKTTARARHVFNDPHHH